jgi:hypothetical protein
MHIEHDTVDFRDRLSRDEFFSEYVMARRPVLIRGMSREWKALCEWTPDYLASKAPDLQIPVKEFLSDGIKKTSWRLKDYVDFLNKCDLKEEPSSPLPYCHDIPIFHAIPGLHEDVCPFPLHLLPQYYHQNWWLYAQFFLGPKFSTTPLHFDCLLTNNLFCQVFGRKKFILFAPADRENCYRDGWRWFRVNPEKPDYAKYPQFSKARASEVIVSPGDMLYMPPGTLHFVRGLDVSISFNIDWHTKSSAMEGVCSVFNGMPLENVYYNFWMFLGLACKVPRRIVFHFYKSYLNYVS